MAPAPAGEDDMNGSPSGATLRGYHTLGGSNFGFRPREVANVTIAHGAYFAVVAASFGQIKASSGKGQSRLLHPFIVLLLAFPLFVAQLTMIFALRLDLDISEGIVKHEELEAPFLLKLKYVMIFVLQLTNFSIMLATIRAWVFIANPVTWIEAVRPRRGEWLSQLFGRFAETQSKALTWTMGLLVRPVLLGTPSFIALTLRTVVSYLVCVDSMSIIFQADSVSTAIFNALVLTFINDLNGIYWDFLVELLHLNDINEVVIEVNPLKFPHEINTGETGEMLVGQDPSVDSSVHNALLMFRESPTCFGGLLAWMPFLSRGKGAREFENVVAFLMLGLLYLQQLWVVLYARMTNVLPVARDLCTLYRWKNDESRLFGEVAQKFVWVLENIIFVNLDFNIHLEEIRPETNCLADGNYYRMLNSDRMSIMSGGSYTYLKVVENVTAVRHRYGTTPEDVDDNQWTVKWFWSGAFIILILMIVPQTSTIQLFIQNVRNKFAQTVDQVEPTQSISEDKAASMKRFQDLQEEWERLKERGTELQKEMEDILTVQRTTMS